MSAARTLTSLAVAAVLAVACGSAQTDAEIDGGPGASSSSSSSGGFGGGEDDAGDGTGGEQSCAATSAETAKAKVDAIFVIDSSGSMNAEMNQVKQNVNAFASKILGVGLDIHVIFIVPRATSPGQTGNVICVPEPLAGPGCADKPPTFFHVNQGVGSTNSFSLILSTYDSKKPELAWKDHLRMEATKVFVEVTDDRSAIAYTEFDKQLLAKAPAGMFGSEEDRKYIFHSIISKPFADAVPSENICKGAAGKSLDYQHLSKLTGGLIDEVCKTDYSGVLDNVAKDVVAKLGCELTYPTAESADPTRLVVQFTEPSKAPRALTQVTDAAKCAGVEDGWYYDDNAAPTKIILCPGMCTTANDATGSKIEALVGCKAPAPR